MSENSCNGGGRQASVWERLKGKEDTGRGKEPSGQMCVPRDLGIFAILLNWHIHTELLWEA